MDGRNTGTNDEDPIHELVERGGGGGSRRAHGAR